MKMHRLQAIKDTYLLVANIDTDQDIELSVAQNCLSPSELQRAALFKFQKDKERYLRSRGLLRKTLSTVLNCSPSAVKLNKNPHGKPYITASDWHFNLSKSGSLAVVILTKSGSIGIDLEQLKQDSSNLLDVSETVLNKEEISYLDKLAASDKSAGFLKFWTAKEAHLKRIGIGLSHEPRECSVILNDNDGGICKSNEHSDSRLFYINLKRDSYICCVAVENKS